jgi:hypothetical protein
MNAKRFWALIDASRRGRGKQFNALKKVLSELTDDELLAFRARFDWFLSRAYLLDLWGAAYWIQGGCSDDGVHMFRVWLVGQGQMVYENAVRDPDTLADVLDVDDDDEEYAGELDVAATRLYEERTGRDDFYERLEAGRWNFGPLPDEGKDWDFNDEDEFRKRFPRLAAMYADDENE